MQPVSEKDKERLTKEKQVCAKCRATPVEWHHVFLYSGRQIPDWFNIVFACKQCHEEATPHNNKYKVETREYFERLILKKHFGSLIYMFPKGQWLQLAKYLNSKYETKDN